VDTEAGLVPHRPQKSAENTKNTHSKTRNNKN